MSQVTVPEMTVEHVSVVVEITDRTLHVVLLPLSWGRHSTLTLHNFVRCLRGLVAGNYVRIDFRNASQTDIANGTFRVLEE